MLGERKRERGGSSARGSVSLSQSQRPLRLPPLPALTHLTLRSACVERPAPEDPDEVWRDPLTHMTHIHTHTHEVSSLAVGLPIPITGNLVGGIAGFVCELLFTSLPAQLSLCVHA